MLLRVAAPTRAKFPPMNQPPAPSETTAFTDGDVPPLTSARAGSNVPVEGESSAAAPVRGPTKENVPPMYVVGPLCATALTVPLVT